VRICILFDLVEFSVVLRADRAYLIVLVYKTLSLPGTPRGQHDVGIRPADSEFPTVVMLSAWVSQRSVIVSEMHQWMAYSRRMVQKVILLVWREVRPDMIGCSLEVYEPLLGEEENEDGPLVVGGRLVQHLVRRT
jgi:hypothetical protein